MRSLLPSVLAMSGKHLSYFDILARPLTFCRAFCRAFEGHIHATGPQIQLSFLSFFFSKRLELSLTTSEIKAISQSLRWTWCFKKKKTSVEKCSLFCCGLFFGFMDLEELLLCTGATKAASLNFPQLFCSSWTGLILNFLKASKMHHLDTSSQHVRRSAWAGMPNDPIRLIRLKQTSPSSLGLLLCSIQSQIAGGDCNYGTWWSLWGNLGVTTLCRDAADSNARPVNAVWWIVPCA